MNQEVNLEEKKKKDTKKGCVLMFFIVLILFVLVKSCFSHEKMNMSIDYTGTQFVVTNNLDVNYTDVKIQLNDVYTLKVGSFPSNKVYTVGVMQFADKTGNRFQIGMKPQKIYIEGIDANGNTASNTYEYK